MDVEQALEVARRMVQAGSQDYRVVLALDRLGGEVERLQAIVDKPRKCWRLNEAGELTQDCLVVPGMVMYFYFGPSYRIELYKRTVKTIEADGWMTWIEKGPERGRMSEDCCNSNEAAEAEQKGGV